MARILSLFGIGGKPSAEETNARSGAAGRDSRPGRIPTRPRTHPRPVEHVEVTSPRLYIGNLSYDAAESDLSDLFNGVGRVQSAEVVTNRHTQRSKGFAFVQMQSVEEARRAVEVLHDKEFFGRRLLVSGAKLPTGSAN